VQADTIAPDKSEIRLLAEMEGGGMTHCTLPPYAVSLAGVHETLEEIWYCVQGRGQVWRKNADAEDIVETFPGVSLTIPPQTHFQFHNDQDVPLCFIIVTMPPWPGSQAWTQVEEHWPLM
jgi:mannose-6-phosphate isomerase-like protein (cupin superfamily)